MSIASLDNTKNKALAIKCYSLDCHILNADDITIDGLDPNSIVMTDGSSNLISEPYELTTWSTLAAGVININALTISQAYFRRIGNQVTAWIGGQVQTVASAFGIITFQLPIAKALSAASELEVIGSGSKFNTATGDGVVISVYAQVGSASIARAMIQSNNIVLENFSFEFSYQIQ